MAVIGTNTDSQEFRQVRIALLTLSDTRSGPQDDPSGNLLVDRLEAAGHVLACRFWLLENLATMIEHFQALVDNPDVDCIISTGGTGVTGRDQAPEALEAVAEKMIPGFGELFRWISYETIGTSTIQSRAAAGVSNGTYIFCLPGSTGACRDAWDRILQQQLDIRYKPCNFIELMPRLQER